MRRQPKNLSLALLTLVAAAGGCGALGSDENTSASGLTFTTVNLPATTATLNVTLPPLTAAEQAVLAFGARNALKIDDRARTTGLAASAGTVTMGNDSSVGAITATGAVTLGDRSHVTGALRTGATARLGNQSTAGSIQQNLSLPPTAIINSTVNIPAATRNVTANPNEVATLAPGSYGQLTVFSGARLTLTTGTYDLRGLDLEPQAQLIVTGPVTVHVTGSLVFRGTIVDGGDATRFQLQYFGTASVRFDTPFRGRIIAPVASIILAGGATTGFCYAASLEINNDTTWTGIPSPLGGISGGAPTLRATGVTFTATQGVSFTGIVANFTDSNTSDTAAAFTATIAWGDGTTSAGVIGGANGMFTVSGTHTYAAAGTFTVTVTIRHTTSGATATATSTANVGRQLAATGVMFSATRGFPFTGQVATFTDANTADTAASFTASINWGDGTTSAGVIGGANGTFTVTGTHTYMATGTFTVTITITDTANGATATATSTALVGNLGATGVMFTATQGVPFTGTVANVFDANSADTAAQFTATIAWGDGTTSAGTVTGSGGTFVVTGTHTYANPGTFTVTISVANTVSGLTATATSTALVGRELTATGINFTALTGVPFTGAVANLTDANTAHTAATFTATIAWGDGATSAGVVTGANGTFVVSGTHTYATVGTFTVTISITNTASGATATATATATVVSSLQFQVWGVTFNASPGVPQPGVIVAHVTDTNPMAGGQLSGTIDWGDGSSPTSATFIPSPVPFSFDVIGSHVFPTSGTFTVTVTATDGGNGATSGALSTAVVAPQLVASGVTLTGAPNANLDFVLIGHLTDANVTDGVTSLSATVDWGDGSGVGPAILIATIAPGVFDVLGNHRYITSGTFTVRISATASGGATATAASTAVIAPQLSATGVTLSALPGVPLNGALIAHLSDTNPNDQAATFQATADFGDGTGAQPVQVNPSAVPGVFDLLGSHTYLAGGTFTVQISVTAANGTSTDTTSTVVVGTQLTGTGMVFEVAPGLDTPVLLGHVQNAVQTDPAGSLSARATWGDGSPETPVRVVATGQPGMFDIVGQHAYRTTGSFAVFVSVTHVVTGATAFFAGTGTVTPGTTLTGATFWATTGIFREGVVAHIIDANPLDSPANFFATGEWGDGTSNLLPVFRSASPGVYDVVGGHLWATAGTRGLNIRVVNTATLQEQTVQAAVHVVDDPATIPQLDASDTRIDAVLNAPSASPGFFVASFVNQNRGESTGNFSVTIDWGDGTTSGPGGVTIFQVEDNNANDEPDAFDVFAPHTYRSTGSFRVTVTISDLLTDNAVTARSTAVVPGGLVGLGTVIDNVVPGVEPPGQGFLVTSFIARTPFENPGDFSITIDWGDGTTSSTPGSLIFVAPTAAPGAFDVISPHVYATSGTYTVIVLFSSALSGQGSANTTINVTPPLAAAGTSVNALVGVTPAPPGFLVASFTNTNVFEQTNSFTVTVDWGDGTPPSSTTDPLRRVDVQPAIGGPPGTFNVLSPHSYATAGTFPITVTISSAVTRGTATATSSASVVPQLRASGTTIIAAPGVAPALPGFLVGSFVDAARSQAPNISATIDWGDGTPPTTVSGPSISPVGSAQSGAFDVFGAHTYAAAGTFNVTVTVTSITTGATATATSTARVSSTLIASGAVLRAAVGAPVPPGAGGFVVASLIDPDLGTAAAALSATIDWGDGTPPTSTGTTTNGVLTTFAPSGVPGTFDSISTHTYGTAATFTATITITKTVTGPPPTTTTTTTTARFLVGM